MEGETICYLLIHYVKARMLQELIFSLFSVMDFSLAFLRLHESFVGKKCEKAWQGASICIFWIVSKERNVIAFNDKGLLV